MIRKLDHIGHVVKNIDEGIKLYGDILRLTPKDMGKKVVVTLEDLGVKIALLPIGDNFIELLEPIGTKGRFARHLKERGEGLFHLCIFVDEFDTEVKTLKRKGYKLEEETTAQLFPGYTVRLAWLSPRETKGVWIELSDMASLPPSFLK